MASVQRNQDNHLGAFNRAYTSRALLPAEAELCNTLGLSVEEYFYFCQLAEAHVKRAPEYELVPDIENGDFGISVLVSLVVGAALSAASYLLTPKPKAPPAAGPEARQIRTADITGQTKFAALYGFDSLQDLANLGAIVPLVFANRDNTKNIGGIRTKALLLWSQMLSRASQQEFKGLLTLGLGPINTIPDIEGFALGDQLLKNYSREKFALYYRSNGGRINEETNRYATSLLPSQGYSDVLLTRDELAPSKYSAMFSGARTPSSQTTFGCYSPISNGSQFWLDYELVLVYNAVDRVKEEKILRPWCIRQAMERKNGVVQNVGTHQINVDDTLTFQISSANEDENAYAPHGLTDVNNGIADRHTFADDNINVGDTYIFGSAIIECIGTSTDKPWEKGDAKSYVFKCIEQGFGYFLPADSDPATVGNLPYGQHLQRIAIGAITNNRKCHQTEIGIKSAVYKRLNGFPNVNSQPENAVLAKYAEDNITFSLGTINRYLTRYSFFKVQARPVGSSITGEWLDISSDQVFAVKGNSPQAQYNVLRIVHPYGQYEYRIVPVPGSTVVGRYLNNPIHLLTGTGFDIISAGQFYIAYSGQRTILTSDMASNPEFVIGGRRPVGGVVGKLAPLGVGELPLLPGGTLVGSAADWDAIARTIKYGVWVNQDNSGIVRAYWNSIDVTDKLNPQGEYRQGAAYGINIPPKLEWRASGSERLNLTTGPDFYIEVDASGRFIGAVWNDANVSAQTQQGDQEVSAAIYRRGTQYTTAQGSTSIVNDPTTPPQYDPYTQGAYFGVWAVRGAATSTWRAFWNGVEVSLNALVEVVPGQVGRYVVGNIRDYFPAINCDVYEIVRQIQTTTGSTRYFYSIEQGAYTQIEPGWTTYLIDKYEFSTDELPYEYAPAEYFATGGTGTGLKVNASSFAQGQWQWLIVDGGISYTQGDQVSLSFPDGTTVLTTVTVASSVQESPVVQASNINPFDAIADYWKYEAEEPSHASNPEHEIVYINEQIRQDTAPEYNDLSVVGLRLLAGREWTSLGQLTAYVQKGIDVERLITDAGAPTSALTAPTNNLPEIAYNLLVSPRLGAGQKVSATSVDRDAMQNAARFCYANGFTWDGVLGERVNLRDWIFTQAAYCLLDFTIIGGRFALVPSVPYNASTFEIASGQAPAISALFTDGNIRNLQVNWLSAEERRLFQAVVSYREEVLNGFSSQKTIRVRLADGYGGAETDPEEAFDLTDFCTNPAQALTFAKHALLLRKEIDHSITFETVPGAAAALTPGAYIKLISEATHTSRFNNGSIDGEGNITSTTDIGDGTHRILYWMPGQTEVKESDLQVVGKTTGDPALFNVVFTVITTSVEKRVYKIETITLTEEGFVQVTATHQPIAANGGIATIQFDPTHFVVED